MASTRQRLLQEAGIGGLTGLGLTLLITLLPPLAIAGEGEEEDKLLLERLERARRGELTFGELMETLGKLSKVDIEGLAERAQRGELTFGELMETLGKPSSEIPREAWDAKVPREAFDGKVKVSVGPVVQIVLHPCPLLTKEDAALLLERLGERAEKGELSVQELLEILGEAIGKPLCGIPEEVLRKVSEAKVPGRAVLEEWLFRGIEEE